MKTTFKLLTFLAALTSVFTFSSCLNNDDNDEPAYYSYVTITGDALLGYTFYADNGSILIPTSSSVQSVLPGLSGSNVKRAFVAFDALTGPADGNMLPGQTYQISLVSSYYANYAIPTCKTIRSREVTDSLHTDNQRISNVNNYIWAANGFLNAELTIAYEQNKTFYLNTYYTDKDIDVANNTLNLNLYYNSKTSSANNQGSSVFSFDLPDEIAYNFQSSDSITVFLNAIMGYDAVPTKAGECKMAVKDFYIPR